MPEVKQNAEVWKRLNATPSTPERVLMHFKHSGAVSLFQPRDLAEELCTNRCPKAGQNGSVLFMVLWFQCCPAPAVWIHSAGREQPQANATCAEAMANYFRKSCLESYRRTAIYFASPNLFSCWLINLWTAAWLARKHSRLNTMRVGRP